MSKLSGHSSISKMAVSMIQKACGNHSLGGSLSTADLAGYVIHRDILDVINFGHWSNFGQAHHFMRRFEGQSERGAYDESVEWIRSNALKAAGTLSERIEFFRDRPVKGAIASHAAASTQISCKLNPTPPGIKRSVVGRQILGEDYFDDETNDVDWQSLGNAMHAVQDSFSLGHVVRDGEGTEDQPDSIIRVKVYEGDDKIDHSKYDEEWRVTKGKDVGMFSLSGKQAINASRELIILVINTGILGNGKKPAILLGWPAYANHWLAASPKLK